MVHDVIRLGFVGSEVLQLSGATSDRGTPVASKLPNHWKSIHLSRSGKAQIKKTTDNDALCL